MEAIAGLPGQKRAEEILNGLACDRGFLKAMGMKKWRVGKLKEMLPDGKVGVDAVCVLGYNVNRGAEIHLRIRTDDMQGFRGMHLIRRVLAHELAHNEVSEHDNRFKEVMRWVERVAERENWRRGGESVGGVEIREDSCGAAGRECGGEVKSGGRVGGVRDVSRLLDARVREMRVDAEGCHAPDMRDGDKPPREDEAGYASRHARAPMQTGGMSAAVKAALREDSGATTQTAHASPAPSARASACAQLASLGFHPTLCRIALRECNQSMSKASDWLLSAPPAHDAAEKTGVFARTESCVRSVQTSVPGEHMVRCLEMLHAYMGNVVREPRRGGRYTRINAENEMFKNRVGMYEGAMKVMREVGWKDGEAGLVWEGELEQVYVAKCVLEEMLRALLG